MLHLIIVVKLEGLWALPSYKLIFGSLSILLRFAWVFACGLQFIQKTLPCIIFPDFTSTFEENSIDTDQVFS